jgi:hypothetical protein
MTRYSIGYDLSIVDGEDDVYILFKDGIRFRTLSYLLYMKYIQDLIGKNMGLADYIGSITDEEFELTKLIYALRRL